MADIWIIGSGNTRQQCIGESTRFVYEVASGRAGCYGPGLTFYGLLPLALLGLAQGLPQPPTYIDPRRAYMAFLP